MIIETKFNINDDVWFVHPKSQQCISGKVITIEIRIGSRAKQKGDGKRGLIPTGEYEEQKFIHSYYLSDKVNKESIFKQDYQLFNSKEKLIESLSK